MSPLEYKIIKNTKIMAHLKIIILFTFLYWIGGKIEKHYNLKIIDENGQETDKYVIPISLYDALYFSLATQTTVGYGKNTPPSRVTQTINIFQLLSIFGIYLL